MRASGIWRGDVLDAKTTSGTAFEGGRAMLAFCDGTAGSAEDEATIDAIIPWLLERLCAEIDTHTSALTPARCQAVAGVFESRRLPPPRGRSATNKPEALAHTLAGQGLRRALISLWRDGWGLTRCSDAKPASRTFCSKTARVAGGDPAWCCCVGGYQTRPRDGPRAAGVPFACCVLLAPSGDGYGRHCPESLAGPHDDSA